MKPRPLPRSTCSRSLRMLEQSNLIRKGITDLTFQESDEEATESNVCRLRLPAAITVCQFEQTLWLQKTSNYILHSHIQDPVKSFTSAGQRAPLTAAITASISEDGISLQNLPAFLVVRRWNLDVKCSWAILGGDDTAEALDCGQAVFMPAWSTSGVLSAVTYL